MLEEPPELHVSVLVQPTLNGRVVQQVRVNPVLPGILRQLVSGKHLPYGGLRYTSGFHFLAVALCDAVRTGGVPLA